ncbi:PREDICTED: filament-like plant protein 4 isoform X2 [Lupinus angustifolius]|uniref:filament-like plant protein 4 isoform X2 n=1 Tax=Lupinus angustifolius TaxID=3871 RepID=UPI00092F2051|nr:PREDICTED: filament-like plant protein 4 isoform X2 [Lupinus angustifolius]
MDRRGWLWKKKSSDKITNAKKPLGTSEYVDSMLSSVANLEDQENLKNKNYVQITMESYTHMSGFEDQVKVLEEKLSAAYSELSSKDVLVKQHAKVAEEAVSGWEKADAEVVSLRRELEVVTLSKLSVEDKASHLDGALKECMKQIRTVKEESEQKLQEVILMKSQHWEKIKLELEAKIGKLDQGLLQEVEENAELLRSLQESSHKILKLKEEKSEAEAEVGLLKKSVQSYEKEINSLKYELHLISKELDIRNEDKDMIMRSAEVANKQHKEAVKNFAKLEGECQRLRGLLRKKLPGPAALAQMKLEVGSLGQVTSGPFIRKSYKTDTIQEYEFLTRQIETLEEEKKSLKEALATSNAELQASRNLYSKIVARLKIQVFQQERSSQKSILETNSGNSSSIASNNPPSITSISDDVHVDPESPVESSAASIPDISDINRVRRVGKFESQKSKTMSELMDDFLEVEKMACLTDKGIVSKANESGKRDAEDEQSEDTPNAVDIRELRSNPEVPKEASPAEHAAYMQDLKETKLILQEKEHLLTELKEQLASSHQSYGLAEIQLKCMTESYKSLQTHVEELEDENMFLKEKMEKLKNDLEEQKQRHHDALVRYKEIEDKMQSLFATQMDMCSMCTTNSAADDGINTGKDMELAAADKKLSECQETLHILGRQLQALCPQIDLTMSHHSKRLQNNKMLVNPSHGWSNPYGYGSCNSNDIDQTEEFSNSSDIQGVNSEFSSTNLGSTSCLSDTEGSLSLNSSIGSNQPCYILFESNSCSSDPAIGNHAHGLSHFFLSKGKNGN